MRSRLLEFGFGSQLSVSSSVSFFFTFPPVLFFLGSLPSLPPCIIACLPGCLLPASPFNLKAGTPAQART